METNQKHKSRIDGQSEITYNKFDTVKWLRRFVFWSILYNKEQN